MKGVILSQVNGDFAIADNLDKPKPGPGQVLVKSLVTGINPVEGFMQSTGMMVQSWPLVAGCDASGTVVEEGEGVTKFKSGDGVFGCTRLGTAGYGTFQEYFLMDEQLAFKTPKNWGDEAAELGATVGVGLLTASLGVISGLKIGQVGKPSDDGSKWIVILGAAGGVGQFAVQIAKLSGFKVLGSCSPSNNDFVKNVGADATFNYRIPVKEQVKEIGRITGEKFSHVFDASAMSSETGMAALAAYDDPDTKLKYFSTTNDWVPIEPKEGIEIYKVTLGAIGQSGDAHTEEVNNDIATFIPDLEKLLESGKLKPLEYEVANAGEIGFESVLKGLQEFTTRKSDGKKLVVRVT